MKFIVDAQLPRSLARLLRERGHDAIHTLELPLKNATTDSYIRQFSIEDERVVISKDSDFFDSFVIKKEPYKLLYLTVGNISNADLLDLFDKNLLHIIYELTGNSVIEMTKTTLTVVF